jgi:hypothetical protein
VRIVRQKVQPFAFHAAATPARDAPHLELQNNPKTGTRQVANLPHPPVVPARLDPAATAADRFFERRSRLTIRTFGSPKTPRTVSFARKPANEYPSDRRRRRVAVLAIPHHARFQHPSKCQKTNIRMPFPRYDPPKPPTRFPEEPGFVAVKVNWEFSEVEPETFQVLYGQLLKDTVPVIFAPSWESDHEKP